MCGAITCGAIAAAGAEKCGAGATGCATGAGAAACGTTRGALGATWAWLLPVVMTAANTIDEAKKPQRVMSRPGVAQVDNVAPPHRFRAPARSSSIRISAESAANIRYLLTCDV
jgi:hypothetical protein